MFRLIKLFLLAALACTLNTNLLFAQFLGLSSEVHATSEHGTTYRIYAHFDSPTDEVLAVYSIGTSEAGSVSLELGVTTSFFQDASFGHRRIASGRRAAFRSPRPARRAKLGVLRSDGHQTLGVDVWSGSGNGVRLPESICRVIASECRGRDAGHLMCELTDAVGKVVAQQPIGWQAKGTFNGTWEVLGLAPGVYTCKILKDDEVLLTTPVLKR